MSTVASRLYSHGIKVLAFLQALVVLPERRTQVTGFHRIEQVPHLPESLGQSLGLRQGDRVEVHRQDNVLWIRPQDTVDPPGPLTDLVYIVSSSLPPNSVDVQEAMNRHRT